MKILIAVLSIALVGAIAILFLGKEYEVAAGLMGVSATVIAPVVVWLMQERKKQADAASILAIQLLHEVIVTVEEIDDVIRLYGPPDLKLVTRSPLRNVKSRINKNEKTQRLWARHLKQAEPQSEAPEIQGEWTISQASLEKSRLALPDMAYEVAVAQFGPAASKSGWAAVYYTISEFYSRRRYAISFLRKIEEDGTLDDNLARYYFLQLTFLNRWFGPRAIQRIAEAYHDNIATNGLKEVEINVEEIGKKLDEFKNENLEWPEVRNAE